MATDLPQAQNPTEMEGDSDWRARVSRERDSFVSSVFADSGPAPVGGRPETDYVARRPLEVHLRVEEDIASAYRDYYKDQVVNDKRNELGRFLFGVSFTTLGFVVSVLALSTEQPRVTVEDAPWLALSGVFLAISAVCSLRLAIPKNQTVDPTTLELIAFHRANSVELSRLAFTWFGLWLVGLGCGVWVLLN